MNTIKAVNQPNHPNHIDEFRALARQLAQGLISDNLLSQKKQRILCFEGVLGAGKTTFIDALLKEWFERREGQIALAGLHISSPTFPIIHVHEFGCSKAVHADLYRIKTLADLQETGFFDEILSANIVLVEWASNVEGAMEVFRSMGSEDIFQVRISMDGESRVVETNGSIL